MNDYLKKKIEHELEHKTGKLEIEITKAQTNQLADVLKDMVWLNELSIWGDWRLKNLNSIAFLKNLTQLTKLDLRNNQISDIEPIKNLKQISTLDLSGNQISDIESLRHLSNLLTLDLRNNQISDIESLRHLSNLLTLDLRNNQISNIEPIKELTNITSFHISNNQIANIEPIRKLTKITTLDLNSNQITNIEPIKELSQITHLDLRNNQIESLRALKKLIVKGHSFNLGYVYDKGIYIGNNSELKDPPPHIIALGNEAILNYWEQLEQEKGNTKYLFEAKMLVIGEGGSGKTTFSRRIKQEDATMPTKEESTHGIVVNKWSFTCPLSELIKGEESNADTPFHVNVWDFGGQEVYHGTHQFFFSEKSLYILVCDTREQKTDFSYWLNSVEQLSGEESHLFILKNKKSGHDWDIDEIGLKTRFDPIIKNVLLVDLNERGQIPDLKNSIIQGLKNIPDIGIELIASWVKIREELAEMNANFISYNEFREVCGRHGQKKKENIELISRYFDRIGVFTHYIDDPILQERVYLNSNWLTNTVYKLLKNEHVELLQGRLTKSQIQTIWKEEEEAFETEKLIALLEKFGLMYQAEKDLFIVPTYLGQKQPYKEWFHANEESIQLQYSFDKYMPKGIMARLIVDLHQYITDQKLVWRKGFNIFHKGAHAEIKQQDSGYNVFEIKAVGSFKRDLIIIITEAFDKILGHFKKLEFEKKIMCPCEECKTNKKPYFFSTKAIEFALIKKLPKNSNPIMECQQSWEPVKIKKLLAFLDYDDLISNVINKIPEKDTHIMGKLHDLGDRLDEGIMKLADQIDKKGNKIIVELKESKRLILRFEQRMDATLKAQYNQMLAQIDNGHINQDKFNDWFSRTIIATQSLIQQLPQKNGQEVLDLANRAIKAEKPKHKLKLIFPFLLGKYEVEYDIKRTLAAIKREFQEGYIFTMPDDETGH